MSKFYFTYGSSGQPFVGGWTEVEAPDRHMACEAFRIFHPDKTEGLLNCSSVYSQEEFLGTGMVSGNLGACFHEYISLKQAEEPLNYFKELKDRLCLDCLGVNRFARDKDLINNRVNYGSVITLAKVLTDIGHKMTVSVIANGDFVIIKYIVIDGKLIAMEYPAEPVKEAVQ